MIAKCSILVALLSASSQILIPIPPNPVPINLAVVVVLLAGSLLGSYWGALSVVVYLLLGIIGLPVYSRFGTGIGHLIGPTGGFLLGYVPAAFVTGLGTYSLQGNSTHTSQVIFLAFAMLISLSIIYAVGTLMFIYTTQQSLNNSLSLTVMPFVLGDLLKITLATILTIKLKKINHYQYR
jgi:biotin transport system substrate-specific component